MKVYLRWTKEIDFGIVEVNTPSEAVEKARDKVYNNISLLEEEISCNFVVEDSTGEVIYKEEF